MEIASVISPTVKGLLVSSSSHASTCASRLIHDCSKKLRKYNVVISKRTKEGKVGPQNRDNKALKWRTHAIVDDISSIASDPAQPQITWEIVVGSIAGVTPFVVAGIEFGKRIVAQRKCKVCGGSGLVLRDNKYYFRCPRCGGFLPWQSWRRFFTG